MPHGFAAVPRHVQALLAHDAPLPMMLMPFPVHVGPASPLVDVVVDPLDVPDDDALDDDVPDDDDDPAAPPSVAFASS